MNDINEPDVINTIIFFLIEFLSLFVSSKRLNLRRYKTLN